MANSAQIRTGIQTLIQDHLSDRLQNTLFDRMPLLYFAFAKDGDKKGPEGLGRPSTGLMLSGVETAKARREEILAGRVYEPIIQTGLPAIADGKSLGMYDTMPSRANWTTTSPDQAYFTRPRVKWCEYSDPYQVPNKAIRATKGNTKGNASKAIGSLFTAETTSVLGVHNQRWTKLLWQTSGTGSPTNEDAIVWDTIHSIRQALGTTNVYCGVDRSIGANAWWKAADTSAYTGGADFETLINYLNYDLGLSKKGEGIGLLLTDGPNFKKAKAEAKAKGSGTVINGGGIKEYGQFGFKRELVQIDNTWIVYDPECPAGHVAALNLDTWTIAVHPDANWKVSAPFDMSQIKGGEDAQVGNVRTELMMVCEVPSLNAYFTGVN